MLRTLEPWVRRSICDSISTFEVSICNTDRLTMEIHTTALEIPNDQMITRLFYNAHMQESAYKTTLSLQGKSRMS